MKRLIVAFIVSVFCVSATSNVQAEDGDGKVKGWTGDRSIVPYRAPSRPRWRSQYPPAAPSRRYKMPHRNAPCPNIGGFHFIPHLYIGPSRSRDYSGRRGGFGSSLGLKFGRYRSYGFRLGVDFF